MIILKIVALQIFWYLAVKYGLHVNSLLFPILSGVLAVANFFLIKKEIVFLKYLLVSLFFALWGFTQESLIIKLGLLDLASYPLWMLPLWIIFICYYGDIFNKFKNLNPLLLAVLGGSFAVLSYYSGVKISGVNLSEQNQLGFYALIFVSWFIFFPLSVYMFYKNSFIDKILDSSVYFSFDASGFLRHEKYFPHEKPNDLNGRNILITGGTSGIGLASAHYLKNLGANIFVTGRRKNKSDELKDLGLNYLYQDLSQWESLEEFCRSCEVFDHLILNAGGMPDKIVLNNYGVETQAASQLFGHYFLLLLLKKYNKISKGARIVWVSSGGMYLKKLSLEELLSKTSYEKVACYANVKRAQITLVEELAKDAQWSDYTMTIMHPGWVATGGLQDSLPGFYDLVNKRLRNAQQGADTINWLIFTKSNLEHGAFYFDRRVVSPYIAKSFIPLKEQREKLLDILNGYFAQL